MKKFSERLTKALFEQDQTNPAANPAAGQAEREQSAQRLQSMTPLPSQGEQKPIEPTKDEEKDEKLDQYVTKEQLRLALQQYPTMDQLEEMFVTQDILNATVNKFVTKEDWKEALDDLLG